jgi:hypothetical protein
MVFAVTVLDPDLVALLKPVIDLAHGRSLVVIVADGPISLRIGGVLGPSAGLSVMGR